MLQNINKYKFSLRALTPPPAKSLFDGENKLYQGGGGRGWSKCTIYGLVYYSKLKKSDKQKEQNIKLEITGKFKFINIITAQFM